MQKAGGVQVRHQIGGSASRAILAHAQTNTTLDAVDLNHRAANGAPGGANNPRAVQGNDGNQIVADRKVATQGMPGTR